MSNQSVADAIERSVSHTEIVTVEYDADVMAELAAACDDSVDAGLVTEYWGTTEDGDEWRVHILMQDEGHARG